MKSNLLEFIDFEKVDSLLEGFNKTTGFVTAVLDLEGRVLSNSGWRQICTEFHRVHPETAHKCRISDTELACNFSAGDMVHSYKCLNGLVEVVVPLVINGEHIANLFTGQFFFEEPEPAFFKRLAEKFGFDEAKYLEALGKVPVVSKEKVRVSIDFLLNMTRLIGEMTFQKMEQTELNNQLKERENQYRNLANTGLALVWTSGTDKLCNYFNDPWLRFTGRTLEQAIGNGWTEGVHADDLDRCLETYVTAFDKREPFEMEYRMRHASGEYKVILDLGTPNFDSKGEFVGYIGHCFDITERKQAEDAMRLSEKHSAFLALTAFELVELTSIQEIYKYTVQKLYELFEGNAIVALVEYNHSETHWKMQQIEGVKEKTAELSRLFGYDIHRMEGDISTKYFEQITSCKVVEIDFDLPGLFNNKLSATVGRTIKKMLSVEKMYCIAFQKNEQIMGNITFITNKKTEPINTRLIETFIQQVTTFLKKQKAEEALRESQEMMRNSQSVAHICSYSTNLNDDEIEKSSWVCSPEFYKIFGIDKTYPHTIAGWTGFIHPECREKMVAYHQNVIKNRTSFNREYKIIRINDGAERWVHGTGELEFDEKGNPVRMHGAIQDITERKQAEMIKQLQFNIARATITTRTLYELFEFIKNELNSIIDAKNIFIALYNEKTGMMHSPFFKDEKDDSREWPGEKSATGYVVKRGHPLLLKREDTLKLKEEGLIEIVGTPAAAWLGVPLTVEGKILGAVVVQNYNNPDAYDQTSLEILELAAHELSMFIDRKRSEEKANKLSWAVEQSSVTVVITNREGTIEYVNPFFTELTGYSSEEATGRNPSFLQSGQHSAAFYQELWDTILLGNDWEGEMLNRKKTGELFWEKAFISPIVNSEGAIMNFVAIKENITERKKMLEELLSAKEKAQESDHLKTAFLNNISHEIRTPLNGILGFGALLLETDPSTQAKKEMLAIVQQSSSRLMNTVTDYLDMARIVSGTMEVHNKVFPLQPFVEEVIEETRPLCAVKEINLETDYQSDESGLTLDSDPELISKILHILLDNALKFTSKGSIGCGYKLKDGFVEFFVKDTGKGIAPEMLDVIFNTFTQEDPSDTRGHEGSGLGLSIASGLVKLLGGNILATSEKNRGSTFVFTVPSTAPELAEKAPADGEKNGAVTGKPLILYAEDEESNYLYLEAVLRLAKCDGLLAKNGEEAVALCKQRPEISLVLMDIKMPVMNGLEATRLIREFRPELPIIATTAYAQIGDENRFLTAGCDGYLVKPIRKEKLLALLKKYST